MINLRKFSFGLQKIAQRNINYKLVQRTMGNIPKKYHMKDDNKQQNIDTCKIVNDQKKAEALKNLGKSIWELAVTLNVLVIVLKYTQLTLPHEFPYIVMAGFTLGMVNVYFSKKP